MAASAFPSVRAVHLRGDAENASTGPPGAFAGHPVEHPRNQIGRPHGNQGFWATRTLELVSA